MAAGRWELWIDRGGTFTDCVGRAPDGRIHIAKVLSSDHAPLDAIRRVLALDHAAAIPACNVRMGTTVATNALLERKGCDALLVITKGFADLLAIGTQARPELFALDVVKPRELYRDVLEIDARAAPDGRVLAQPDEDELEAALRTRRAHATSVAVVVMHAYAAPDLERRIGACARRAGFEHVSLSHELGAQIGMLARGDTAMVDAYLTPLLADYLARLGRELPGSRVLLMQSSGGLVDASRFRGPSLVLSGPAGGVVACARLAERYGLDGAIGFDMGGTSTDVCRIDRGKPEWSYEHETAGARLRAPMLAVHTVASGGGSLCRFDGLRFLVGPESAAADPGPMCFGKPEANGLALTDIDFALGRVLADRFPFPLHRGPVLGALEAVGERAGMGRDATRVAAGFYAVANQHMAEAIKRISVARGHDLASHTLIVFGGAAGQHGCAVARLLGIRRLLAHPLAGVLSAYGMGLADMSWHGVVEAGRVELSDAALAVLANGRVELEAAGRAHMAAEGVDPSGVWVESSVELRYRGTETSISVAWMTAGAMRGAFEAEHLRAYGHARHEHVVEIAAVRVRVVGEAANIRADAPAATTPQRAPIRVTRLWTGNDLVDAPVYAREALAPGIRLEGPAVVLEDIGTLVLDPGFSLTMDDHGCIWMEDEAPAAQSTLSGARDPVQLELFYNRFTSIAEQMGVVLQRTALSTNIRERLDFSCAVFDSRGDLVANAPHIPVHLGAMSETVRSIIALHPDAGHGDAFISNDPEAGGSHLPDITVVTAVDVTEKGRLWVASRGHHADVGGATPGSMPPLSRALDDEGVVIRALCAVRGGVLDERAIRGALAAGPHPARNPDENLADLEAQLAANQTGARLLCDLAGRFGHRAVAAYMQHVLDDAAEEVAAAIARLVPGERRFVDRLDDGTPIAVRVTVAGAHMHIDFAGTGSQVDGNLNAPRAVTVAAVLYVLRLLCGKPIPLSSGCLRPITLTIPSGSVLWPDPGRAVAGGNVETSQRVVDVLLGALELSAASQGTMNNLTLGTERWGYYETLGGGTGGTPRRAGASAVHSHMTNTRITDVEVLEARFPLRVIELSIRRGSGGVGLHPGGDGLVREIEALEPMTASILSERRARRPFGMAGGSPGRAGRNVLGGRDVGSSATVSLRAGERIRIETPGGGGWGEPPFEPGQ